MLALQTLSGLYYISIIERKPPSFVVPYRNDITHVPYPLSSLTLLGAGVGCLLKAVAAAAAVVGCGVVPCPAMLLLEVILI